VNNVGDVLTSSVFSLSWPGDRSPRKAVGLVDLRVQRCLWHQRFDEVPACMEETVATEERFCIALV